MKVEISGNIRSGLTAVFNSENETQFSSKPHRQPLRVKPDKFLVSLLSDEMEQDSISQKLMHAAAKAKNVLSYTACRSVQQSRANL